ncbi:FkbM family methyltransferase [Haloarcula salina]|uniref:FkbM family methyltransferase n=1 Tax=Haloarcula salina TaxID=1429914 RepID=UPI003C704A99
MRERITSSPLWDAASWLGIDEALSGWYWAGKLCNEQYWRRKTVGGVSAAFTTTTRAEYVRVETLTGEEAVLRAFLDSIEPDDVVYDVGANIGLFACFAARALRAGAVVGFEPEPENCARAEENLARNAGDTTFEMLRIGLSDTDGEAKLRTHGGLGDGTHRLSGRESGRRITVPTRRTETLIDAGEIPVPDVVKIDVEGAEFRVLEGFGEYLSDVHTVVCEVHTDKVREFGDSPAMIERLLEKAGFETAVLMERGLDYHVIATPEAVDAATVESRADKP